MFLQQGGRIPRPQSVQRVLTTGWSVATTRLVIEPSSKSLRSQTLAGPQICGKPSFRLLEQVTFSGNRTYAGTQEGKSPGDLTRAKEFF